jgi:Ser/Thr protein kinase RdoA (MazF antagonist)
VTAFRQQPYETQVTHLTAYARRALAAWGWPNAALSLVLYANNAVFRFQTPETTGGLRVYRPGKRPRPEIEAEWAWLGYLQPRLAGQVPRQLTPIYTGHLPDEPNPVYAVAWAWLPGRGVQPAELTPATAARFGAFLARLHTVAIGWREGASQTDIDRPRLDYAGLFGKNSPYNPGDGAVHISEASQRVLDAVAARVERVMATLDTAPNTFGLIHGDFIYKNTLWDGERVRVVDFEDCGYGYYLYDLATPLLFYKALPAYAALKQALWDGYTGVRPIPADYRPDLETLIAGRYVASCRWVAGNAQHPSLRGKAADIIDQRAAELQTYLATGVL